MKKKKIVFAFDSFKECMTAKEACDSGAEGFIKAGFLPENCLCIPMADGGEGTMDALIHATGGTFHTFRVTSPTGDDITALAGQLPDKETWVIDCASCCGLSLIPKELRNPLHTTSYGLGSLILHILDQTPKRLIIGLGGSGTNDAGLGMLTALGIHFLDKDKKPVPPGNEGVGKVHSMDMSELDPRIKNIEILVACDVNNPFTGPTGATHVYSPQKGATPDMVETMEENMIRFHQLLKSDPDFDLDCEDYFGAAGGLGLAIHTFLNGTLSKGIDLVLTYSHFEEQIKNADYVITGEGKLDFQTKFGKTPAGVLECAKKHHVPVIAIAGTVDGENDVFYNMGFDAVFSLNYKPQTLEESMAHGMENMKRICENLARLI